MADRGQSIPILLGCEQYVGIMNISNLCILFLGHLY